MENEQNASERPLATEPRPRRRDAERSREAILAAAEELFAARGYAATSLGDVATAAGLSRGAPSYFFGNKDGLYGATLERVFASRERATREACRPLREWASNAGETADSLAPAMAAAVAGYLDFLRGHPAFLRLLQREELDGAERLGGVSRESRAIEEALGAVRDVGRERALRPFDLGDAVLLFVSLTFGPLAQRSTFLAALGRDLEDERTRRRHVDFVVDQLLYLLGA